MNGLAMTGGQKHPFGCVAEVREVLCTDVVQGVAGYQKVMQRLLSLHLSFVAPVPVSRNRFFMTISFSFTVQRALQGGWNHVTRVGSR